MVFWTGIMVWVAAIALLLRLTAIGVSMAPIQARRVALWCLLILGASVLLFRPHEVILGGQDPGVYVNTAAAFARHDSVFFEDTMLAQVSPQDRSDFLFGHGGYGATKDSCLAIRDVETARVGPRFPPLFAVVLSVPARFGHACWMLYVVPFFTLCAAVALSVLARQLVDHSWAGVLSFVFYLTTPLLAWHARAPRPEMIAVFLSLGGCALVINAWRAARWRNWFDIAGGALCIALAPFFHVTAWFLAVAFAVPVGMVILSGRYDFLLYVPAAFAGLAGLVFQTFRITDHYGLRRFIEPLARYWIPAAFAFALLLGLLAAWSFLAGRRELQPPASMTRHRVWAAASRLGRPAFAVLMTGVFVTLFLGHTPIHARRLVEPAYHYAYPTDMRVAEEFLSLPVLLIALAGVVRLVLSRTTGSAVRLAVVFGLLPACWLIGNMYDMFMTRYMLTAIVPLTALGLVSVITFFAARGGPGKAAAVAGTVAVVVWQAFFGWHLAATTEYRGMTVFLGGFAKEVREADGILLCEYSRVGVPLEHMFGIPTLSLDNETRHDYSRALASWDSIMRKHPGNRAFFLTPFSPPVSELFEFKPVKSGTVEYPRIRSELFRRPRKAGVGDLSLSLYEMIPGRDRPARLPFVRQFDAGNMGLRGFSRERTRQWEVQGLQVVSGSPAEVRLDRRQGSDGDWNLLLFFLGTSGTTPPAPELVINDGAEKAPVVNWECIAGDWWILRAGGSTRGSVGTLRVASSCDLLLTDVVLDSALEHVTLKPSSQAGDVRTVKTAPYSGRWSRASCGFLAPVPSSGGACLLVLVQAPKESAGPVNLSVSLGDETVMTAVLPAGVWTWQAAPLEPRTGASGVAWFEARVEPPWNSGEDGYPGDLGVRFGCIAVLPGVSNAAPAGR